VSDWTGGGGVEWGGEVIEQEDTFFWVDRAGIDLVEDKPTQS